MKENWKKRKEERNKNQNKFRKFFNKKGKMMIKKNIKKIKKEINFMNLYFKENMVRHTLFNNLLKISEENQNIT